MLRRAVIITYNKTNDDCYHLYYETVTPLRQMQYVDRMLLRSVYGPSRPIATRQCS